MRDKGNIFNIESATTACCTYMPYEVNSWGAMGYAVDPAVVIVNFSVAGAPLAAKVEDLKAHGTAIGALGRSRSGKRILYIDSLEGGDKFNRAIKGNEDRLLTMLQEFGREVGAEEVAIHTIARKWPGADTPVEFANALAMPKARRRMGILVDGPQYFECFNLQQQYNMVESAAQSKRKADDALTSILRARLEDDLSIGREEERKLLRREISIPVKSIAIRKG